MEITLPLFPLSSMGLDLHCGPMAFPASPSWMDYEDEAWQEGNRVE